MQGFEIFTGRLRRTASSATRSSRAWDKRGDCTEKGFELVLFILRDGTQPRSKLAHRSADQMPPRPNVANPAIACVLQTHPRTAGGIRRRHLRHHAQPKS